MNSAYTEQDEENAYSCKIKGYWELGCFWGQERRKLYQHKLQE